METKSDEHAVFAPELVKRYAFRQDKPFYPRLIYYNSQATRDSIRHFTEGYGDTNPLYYDREYAKKTKYGGIVAPPCFPFSVQWSVMGSLLTGIHGWYSGGEWEWWRPIYEGDELKVVSVVREMEEKAGRMGKGRTWITYYDNIYINQREQPVSKERGWAVNAERGAAGSAGKYRNTPKPMYTQDDTAKFGEMYDKEELRGARPRYWEDVQVGDELGPLLKGPLSVRDMIGWLMGAGSPYFKAHKIEHEYEKRHPRALEYVPETGERDVPELVHVLDQFARTIGVERAYDYGNQRMTWQHQLFTNWMGDEGWLWKMRGELRVFNQIGDVTIFQGVVKRKYVEDGKRCVDIEVWAKNQRDEYSMAPNLATVILPSREYGPVAYPQVPDKVIEDVKRARPLDEMIKEGVI